MPPISVSPYMAFPDRTFDETLEVLDDLGVAGIEVALLDDLSVDTLAERLDARGLNLTTLAGSSALEPTKSPCLADAETHEEAVEAGRDLLATAGDFGCDQVVITLGGDQGGEHRQRQFDRVVAGLEQLGQTGQRHCVDVLIEPHNVVDYPDYVVNTYRSGKRLVDQVDSPRVGLLFDTYHVQRGSGNLLATYEACKPHIDHVHVANVPGRGNLDHGELNFEFVLGELLDRGYQGSIGLEYSPNAETDAVSQLRESVRLIKRVDS